MDIAFKIAIFAAALYTIYHCGYARGYRQAQIDRREPEELPPPPSEIYVPEECSVNTTEHEKEMMDLFERSGFPERNDEKDKEKPCTQTPSLQSP